MIQPDSKDVRIVMLANQPRMFRKMLRQILDDAPGVQLTLEVENPAQIPDVLNRVQADWLIISLANGESLPTAIEDVVDAYPELSVIGISEDENHIKVRLRTSDRGELACRQYSLNDVSLQALLRILNDHAVS